MVRVLVFIDHYVSELALIVLAHLAVVFKQADRVADYIVKIHCVGLFKLVLIHFIGYADFLKADVLSCLPDVFLRRNKVVLSLADFRKNCFIRQHALLDIKLALALLHQPF